MQTAEAKVETYRSTHDLFDTGSSTTGTTTLSQQQLSDLNTELTRTRATRADAEAKASQIRQALQANNVPNVTDVLNSQLIQNLVAQEVELRAQIAQLNATLLPAHPKMRELNAQLAGLDGQIAGEAKKILESLEGEAKLAAAREDEIQNSLTGLKQTAATANDAGVELRALEREAAAERDLLESYLGRYREALAREQGQRPAGRRAHHFARQRLERSGFPEEDADDAGRDVRCADPGDRLHSAQGIGERPADAPRQLRGSDAGGAGRQDSRRPLALGPTTTASVA